MTSLMSLILRVGHPEVPEAEARRLFADALESDIPMKDLHELMGAWLKWRSERVKTIQSDGAE